MTNNREITGQRFERKLELDRTHTNLDAMTIPATLSSEAPARQWFGMEVLKHGPENINLDRAQGENGLPLLLGHDPSVLIGRVKNIKTTGKKTRGILHFSSNTEKARETWADVRDGFLTDISIGYEIDDIIEPDNRDDPVQVTRWTLLESSVVTVPADATIGINRSKHNEVNKMEGKKDETVKPATDDGLTVASFQAAQTKAAREGTDQGVKLERERVKDITRVFDMHGTRKGVADLRTACIDEGTAASRAGELLLEFLAGEPESITREQKQQPGQHGQRIEGGADESDKWIEGITESLEVRAGLITDREARRKAQGSEFNGMSLLEMARSYLGRQRAEIAGMNRQQIAGQAFVRAGQHGTSDFSNVLENVANKAMMIGFDEAAETWNRWCRIGNLSDFKVASRVNISSFSDLELVLESGEYKEGHLSDLKETIQLAKYGKLFTISREAIINDDVDAFSRIPRAMGQAANRQVGDLAYAILTANAALNQDATALFHANHSNLGTGGVITETTLDEFGRLMGVQTSPAPGTGETGATLNIMPKFLLVPRAILMTANKIVKTVTAPDTAGDLAVNTQFNAWEVISDGRLDADSAVQYYGLADPNLADTIEVAFLDGNDTPFMESKDGFTQDGVSYKVRIEAAATALDFRGVVRNAGA